MCVEQVFGMLSTRVKKIVLTVPEMDARLAAAMKRQGRGRR